MDLIKFEEHDALTEDQFDFQAGYSLAGALLLVTGTNNTGQTGTDEDLGRIELTLRDDPIINRNFNNFVDMGDIRAGANVFSSATGGAFQASCFIPFWEKGHPNTFEISKEGEFNFRWIPADDGTVFADLTVQCLQQIAGFNERYIFNIKGEETGDSGASVDNKNYPLRTSNVSSIYGEDVGGVLDKLQFQSSNRTVVSNLSELALQAYTNYNNRIEDNTFSIFEIENHTPGLPGTTFNNNNILSVTTTGAGKQEFTVCSMDWHEK